uniref:Uncharacterized protein n=1 Tax=Anguilla anguilla TaxID=7936 RepID=A0A0E9V5H8_ANGAN
MLENIHYKKLHPVLTGQNVIGYSPAGLIYINFKKPACWLFLSQSCIFNHFSVSKGLLK